MSKEEPYRDQAEKLRKKIEKYNESSLEETKNNLPPRGQLHRNKKKKTKWRLKFPLLRLLVLFFILLPITIFSIYSYIGSKHIGTEKASVSSKGYETINFEKSKSEQTNYSTENSNKEVSNPKLQKEKSTENSSNNSTTSQQTIDSENNNGQVSVPPSSPQSNSQAAIGKESDTSTNIQADPSINQSNTVQDQSNTVPSQVETKKIVYHTVQPHETLYHIAMNYYHSKTGVETIKAANHLQTNSISTGQVLKIPLNK
ncbi:LysM peptidoglycan-binding domain-containing protein [Bacillus sp. EB600]|uniref:LysM peptidoglycan-binding domain-containing protein n=1 Tax=Bacillus sp. EB600 TaxID=2806345 RepID=UPI00210D66E6|nr:LysM peptidoglycan-binding domain-containing protein [Bacillus sp. EB600]MCQ6277950.1 LysM peptidoglycan-binding domain-containing protein [Bacillus sp. EB600]